jgi:hypothetical protein
LIELAKKQQLDPKDFDFNPWLERGFIKKIRSGKKDYAVIVQDNIASSVPGTYIEQVVLLTTEGKILDRIRCEINSRFGTMRTSVSDKPDSDDAQIIIRFEGRKYPNTGQALWHNWHVISYHEKKWAFGAAPPNMSNINKPNIWNEKGLCRIGIAEDKFKVIFPKLEMPDFSKAKSLKITFHRRTEKDKRIVVDDSKEAAELCKLISVKSASVSGKEGIPPDEAILARFDTLVDFVTPDGKTIQVGFYRPDIIYDTLSGNSFDLDSDFFYQTLTKVVSKAEGRPVELGYPLVKGGSGNAK